MGGGRVDGDNGWVCGVGAGWMEWMGVWGGGRVDGDNGGGIKDGCVGWGQGGWR